MWVSDDGRLNTVALPDPSEAMAGAFRHSLEALARIDPDSLHEVIEEAEDAAFSRDWSELGGEDQFVGVAPPVEILRGNITSSSDLADALKGVELRWRLDAIMAVSDYLDRD